MSKRLPNFEGRQIGKWKVLKRIGGKPGGIEYYCQCSCGRKSYILATRLKDSKGCRRCATRIPDLPLGFKSHSWTVISEPQSLNGKNGVFYRCRCTCGIEKYKEASALSLGKAVQCRSCSARKKKRAINKSVVGKKFGNWLVLNEDPISKNNKYYYKCECQCHAKTISYIRAAELTHGRRNMCFMCRRILVSKKQWEGYGDISKQKWLQIQKNAKIRNLVFNISIQYAWDLFLKQGGKCALSGIPISFKKRASESLITGELSETTASLDRINSSFGYTEDNIQWVHKDIQQMKFDLPNDRFISFCRRIAENHKN